MKEEANIGTEILGCVGTIRKWISGGEEDVSLIGSRGYKSIMQKSLHFTYNARFREILMEIAVMCSENTIGNFVSNVDDIRILFDSLSPAVLEFFENGFLETQ